MSALAAEHNAINLSQGFPDFPIDSRLAEFVKRAMDDNQNQYAPMAGRQDLREAIAAKLFQQHQISVSADLEITITAGATEAIFSAMACCIEPGDEVILFDPAYDCYDPTVRLLGGKPVHIALKHPAYSIDWDEVKTKVSAATKMIVVNNPHNPCGSVLSPEDLDELEKQVDENPGLILLSDEVYEHIQYEGEHQSVLKRDVLRQRSFVTYSFGKTFHATGWKIGYCVAPPLLTTEFRKVHQFNVFCVNNPMQAAIARFLNETSSWKEVQPLYLEKRNLFLEQMSGSRFKPLACSGTYFCLMDYSAISDEPDTEFARRVTKEYGVASIPVSVFYPDLTDHKVVRFCFAKKDETLTKATERLCQI